MASKRFGLFSPDRWALLFNCGECTQQFGRGMPRCFDNGKRVPVCVPCAKRGGYVPTKQQKGWLASAMKDRSDIGEPTTHEARQTANLEKSVALIVEALQAMNIRLDVIAKRQVRIMERIGLTILEDE